MVSRVWLCCGVRMSWLARQFWFGSSRRRMVRSVKLRQSRWRMVGLGQFRWGRFGSYGRFVVARCGEPSFGMAHRASYFFTFFYY